MAKNQPEVTTMKTIITRRDFLRIGAAATVGGLLGLPRTTPAEAIARSRVILIRNKDVIGASGSIRAEVLEQMMDQAMTTLIGTPDPVSAWEQLVKAEDVVGIKSNAWYQLPTPRSLEAAIHGRLLQVGVKKENMAADDRGVLSNPVFQRATALINTRPMRTHYWSGLGTLLKNYIMFTPRPSDYHDNACENLGALWHFPQVKGKTRLN
ncbi:MAG: twin-arginine translocation signal domain-containing protein, partial [Desulfobacteraceae bacterium]